MVLRSNFMSSGLRGFCLGLQLTRTLHVPRSTLMYDESYLIGLREGTLSYGVTRRGLSWGENEWWSNFISQTSYLYRPNSC